MTRDIFLNVDGKSVIKKINPKDQNRASKRKKWGKSGEGLKPDYTTKGYKISSDEQIDSADHKMLTN